MRIHSSPAALCLILDVAGCFALSDARPASESKIVRMLRESGVVLLGKTNLSEWGNMRAWDTPDGWSPMGGQSYGPYCHQQDPTGSSSGSAIAVATGLCGFALGIEVSMNLRHT